MSIENSLVLREVCRLILIRQNAANFIAIGAPITTLGYMKMSQVPTQLHIVHLTLMLAPALFSGLVYFLIRSGEAAILPSEQTALFQYVAAVLAIIAVAFSQLLPRFLVRGEKSLTMQKYFTLKIVQWAMIEAAALFIAVIFFLSHHINLLIPIGVLIALIALLRPTSEELERYGVKSAE